MIVKVQLPVLSWDDSEEAPALVYNEDRSVMLMVAVTDEILAVMEGPKGFFEAEVDDDGLLHLGASVEDPGW